MNLFKNPVAKAVGAALALASGSAFAYQPTSNDDADVVLYWGGASASTLSGQELTLNAICASDSHLLYVPTGTGATPGAPLNDWVVACRTSAAKTGLADGTRVLIVKRDRGGSGVGVGPVQVNSTITFLNVAGNCTGTPGAGAPPFPGVTVQTCAATYTANRLTEMGTSDIEPNKFFGINTPVVDTVSLPFLNVPFQEQFALSALTFNTPVTLALYRTLQSNQFPVTSSCNPAHADYGLALPVDPAADYRAGATVGESEGCMPSLTRSEIASLLATGRITQWNRLVRSDGSAITAGPGLPAIGTLAVQICRRTEGSGSQATINAEINGWPCDTDASDATISIVAPKGITVPGPGPVFGNAGSGDISNCLRDRNLDIANPYAIGILSVEGRNADKALGWRYIKVDGAAPTLKNIHGGDYYLFSQQSCQRRSETLNYNAPVNVATDTVANKALLFTALCGPASTNGLNNVNALNVLNAGSVYDWGYSGWLATPTTALTYDNVLDYKPVAADGTPARPVNAFTREIALGVTNHCQTPLKSSFGGNSARGMIIDSIK